jgi:hypothetical protein
MRTIHREERPVPDFVEDAHGLPLCVAPPQRAELALELRRGAFGGTLSARERAYRAQEPRDVTEALRLGDEDAKAESLESFYIRSGIPASPGEHEIGLDHEHALDVDPGRIAKLRQRACGFGIIAEANDREQLLSGSRGECELREMRRKRDDSRRRRGEVDRDAAVILDIYTGGSRCCERGANDDGRVQR